MINLSIDNILVKKSMIMNCVIVAAVTVDDDDSVEAATTKEEKNAFAMRVLRRIRTKLEGREPGEWVS